MIESNQIQYVKDTFPEYLSKKDHVAASDLKKFLKSPAIYYYERYEKTQKTEERHFSIGSGLHELILEPEFFASNYVVFPKVDKRTVEGRRKLVEFTEQAQGKTILYEDEMSMIIKMAENAMKNNTLGELLKDSYRELSCYTTDAKTGLKLRMRPDSISKTKSTITDIKSCVDSSAKRFKNDVYSYGYAISAAYYCDFLGRENYIFAAIEKEPPYQVSLFTLDDEIIEYGRQQYRMGLDLLKWSIDNNYWCNYNEFDILKECYSLGDLDSFFETLKKSEVITVLYK